jgi:DNA-binding CsgD family transcriptional regulator
VRLIALADGWWPDLPHADLAAAGITRAAPDRPGPLLTHPRWLEAAVELDRPDGWQADVRDLLSAAPHGVPPARAAALAAAAGEAERAADLWLTAARRARGEHAPLSEALALLASVEHRFDPATALTAAQRAFDTGMAAQALDVLDRVLARLPRDASAAALLVRCRARYYVGDVAGAETDLDGVLERWDRAAAPVRSDAAVLQALRLAAADPAAAQQWARTAQDHAATPAQQGRAHAALALAIGIAGEVDQAIAGFETALALLEDAGEVADAGRAASNRIFVLWRAGRLEAMLRAIDDELRRLEQLGLAASAGSHLLPGRAAALWTLGRWEELTTFLAQVRPLAGGMAADAAALVRLVEVELTAARGDVATARHTLAAVVPTGPEVAAERAAVALGLAELDDLPVDEAVVQQGIAAATGDGFAQARIAVALLRLGQPVPPELHTATPTDPSPESAAVAVEARAWHGEAAWTDAALAWEAVPNPYRAAWCRWRSGTLDDLAAAQGTAERLGAGPLAHRVGRSLRNAGVHRARTAGPLTARELDVLALVARGLTNREVARALRMSDRTVGVHLGHIYTKLGAGTRAEAAHLARQQGLVD